MKIVYGVILLPIVLWSEGLKELIVYAKAHNHQLKALEYGSRAKEKSLDSSKSEYLMPKVFAGGSYRSQSPASPFQAQDTFLAYGKVSIDLYDGGKILANIAQKRSELEASKFDEAYNTKALELSIVNNFFNIQNQKALLTSLEEEQRELQAQIERIETFYRAELVTIDKVDKIKSAFANTAYQITAIQQQIFSLKKSLGLKLGREVEVLTPSSIVEPSVSEVQTNDHIQSLDAKANALVHTASSLDSAYRPHVSLEDTFNIYEYAREESNPMVESLKHQNTIMLNVNMQLFDNGAIKKQKQALLIQHQAMQEQIDQAKYEQRNNSAVALAEMATAKEKIHSANLALKSANSVYNMIEQKFDAKIVDNVTYLDALSDKTSATVQHQIALNSLEVAKANYYFQLGLDIEEFVNE